MKKILQRLFVGETITIDPTNGLETLVQARDVFKSYIDPDLKKLGFDKPEKPTGKTEVIVHEMVEDATFDQIFRSFGVDLDKLCFTGNQIKDHCRKNQDRLHPDYGNFFLMKKKLNIFMRILDFILKFIFGKTMKGKYFVVSTYVFSDGLSVGVLWLEFGGVFGSASRHRVVSPRLPSVA